MKGLSAEPGERSARLMSTWPARRASKKSAEPTRARTSPVALSTARIATEMCGPMARARSRASSCSDFCNDASMVRRCTRMSGSCETITVGGLRRQHRQQLARVRHGLRLGVRDLVARHHAGRRHAVEHAVARLARALGVAVGPARLRRLRQRDQQRRLRERERARLLAEIGKRGRADAFEVAAIGRERQIERENLVLAERVFELERAHDLMQLGARGCDARRGSSRRATCMVSVEPPETIWPLVTNCHAARSIASRIDAVMLEKRLSS